MKPAAFRYHGPASLVEALALLAEHGDAAKAIAGGQSLVPMMNLRVAQPAELIDLNHIKGLSDIRDTKGFIEVGSLVRHQALADSELVRRRCPLLAEAASGIGHYAIRQRGTLGGSLAHSDPAAQLPLVAVTLGAEIELASPRGRRMLSSDAFFMGVMTTALAADELIVAVRFPVSQPGEGSAFRLFNRRRGDYALVSVAATLQLRAGTVDALRLGVGAVEPTPLRLTALATAQRGRHADAAWTTEVAALVAAAVDARDALLVPAVFRRELTETLVERALAAAIDRIGA